MRAILPRGMGNTFRGFLVLLSVMLYVFARHVTSWANPGDGSSHCHSRLPCLPRSLASRRRRPPAAHCAMNQEEPGRIASWPQRRTAPKLWSPRLRASVRVPRSAAGTASSINSRREGEGKSVSKTMFRQVAPMESAIRTRKKQVHIHLTASGRLHARHIVVVPPRQLFPSPSPAPPRPFCNRGR